MISEQDRLELAEANARRWLNDYMHMEERSSDAYLAAVACGFRNQGVFLSYIQSLILNRREPGCNRASLLAIADEIEADNDGHCHERCAYDMSDKLDIARRIREACGVA